MPPRRASGREIAPLLPHQSSAPPTLAPFADLSRYAVACASPGWVGGEGRVMFFLKNEVPTWKRNSYTFLNPAGRNRSRP